MHDGEMREWLKRLPWKGSDLARGPRVRIPLSPPNGNLTEWFMVLVLKTRDPERGPGVRIPQFPPDERPDFRTGLSHH